MRHQNCKNSQDDWSNFYSEPNQSFNFCLDSSQKSNEPGLRLFRELYCLCSSFCQLNLFYNHRIVFDLKYCKRSCQWNQGFVARDILDLLFHFECKKWFQQYQLSFSTRNQPYSRDLLDFEADQKSSRLKLQQKFQ